MLDKVAAEIFLEVISSLEPLDLKSLRLVRKSFSEYIIPALFRKIDVSCLTLKRLRDVARHPTISQAVQELCFHELSLRLFDPRTDWPIGLPRSPVEFAEMVVDYYERCYCLKIHRGIEEESASGESTAKHWGLPIQLLDKRLWNIMPRPSRGEVLALVDSILYTYRAMTIVHDPDVLYRTFCETLPKLGNLRRIVCVEADLAPKALGHRVMEQQEPMQRLNEIFPISDVAIRTAFMNLEQGWPCHGRGSDAFCSSGIDLLTIDVVNQEHGLLANAFGNLTSLTLCLEVNAGRVKGRTWGSARLVAALAGASKLECLEICLTTSTGPVRGLTTTTGSEIPLHHIIPFNPMLELDTVVFDGVHFWPDEFCPWLFMQPKLTSITIRRCYVHGRWRDMVEIWSQKKDFVLEALEVTSPWDHDVRDQEVAEDGPKVPSRVSSDELLTYINCGGTNPFDNRRWRRFDDVGKLAEGKVEDDIQDHMSDYSDMSVWEPEDHPEPVEDPLGPEFYSDYDFDTEEDDDDDLSHADEPPSETEADIVSPMSGLDLRTD